MPSSAGVPERCAIYRGSDKVLWVDLKGLLDTGSPMADMRLKRDDIVYVPSPAERYVSVLGEVTHPGALQLETNSTLPKLIALAGGLTDRAGKYPDIQIISPATGRTRVISFKQVLQPGVLDLTLQSGDIIYIPMNGFNRFGYALEKISPLVTVFTAAAFFHALAARLPLEREPVADELRTPMSPSIKRPTIEGMPSPAARPAANRDSAPPPAFDLDVKRSVQRHPKLAAGVGAVVLALVVAFGLTRTKMYQAESLTYIEPMASKVLNQAPTQDGYDSVRYDTYIQQQTQTALRPDILATAIGKLPPFV